MGKRLKRPFLIIFLLFVFLFIKKWSFQDNLQGSSNPNSIKSISKISLSKDQTTDLKRDKIILRKIEEQNQLKEAYEKAAYDLADKIEKHQLDGVELNKLFSKLGRERFLRRLPEEVKAAYLNLEDKILPLQKNLQKEDGIHEEFFNRYQTFIPTHLKNQREELEKVQLNSHVEDLIDSIVQKDQVSDQDVDNILNACGMKNVDCINKSFALVIEANHGLSEMQLKNIREYL